MSVKLAAGAVNGSYRFWIMLRLGFTCILLSSLWSIFYRVFFFPRVNHVSEDDIARMDHGLDGIACLFVEVHVTRGELATYTSNKCNVFGDESSIKSTKSTR